MKTIRRSFLLHRNCGDLDPVFLLRMSSYAAGSGKQYDSPLDIYITRAGLCAIPYQTKHRHGGSILVYDRLQDAWCLTAKTGLHYSHDTSRQATWRLSGPRKRGWRDVFWTRILGKFRRGTIAHEHKERRTKIHVARKDAIDVRIGNGADAGAIGS